MRIRLLLVIGILVALPAFVFCEVSGDESSVVSIETSSRTLPPAQSSPEPEPSSTPAPAPPKRVAVSAEEILRGKSVDDAALQKMGEVAATECDPTDDNRGSAEYKREMVKVLVRRAAQEALRRLP